MEKGNDREKNRISLFFVESPEFFSWVSMGWQVCIYVSGKITSKYTYRMVQYKTANFTVYYKKLLIINTSWRDEGKYVYGSGIIVQVDTNINACPFRLVTLTPQGNAK